MGILPEKGAKRGGTLGVFPRKDQKPAKYNKIQALINNYTTMEKQHKISQENRRPRLGATTTSPGQNNKQQDHAQTRVQKTTTMGKNMATTTTNETLKQQKIQQITEITTLPRSGLQNEQ